MDSEEKKPLSEFNFPDQKLEALLERIDFVQKMLDRDFTDKEKAEIRADFMEQTRCTERTIRNYLKRYRDKGITGLVLNKRRNRKKSRTSPELVERMGALIRENPKRSIPKIRELLLTENDFRQEAETISMRQFYRIAQSQGYSLKERLLLLDNAKTSYRSFEAPCSMALVQGDARDGIWLLCPDGKNRKTYLFAWVDDYSRKILYGQYYWDEKLPRMEDSFRKMILRYGYPVKIYLDNGSVYISRQFFLVLHDLGIKKIHHPAYKAFCKGKVESVMKKIKNDFQSEAQYAGIRTLEELNTAFHAWVNVKYDKQILSTTGEAPGRRFIKGLTANVKRVENLDKFMQYFLWRDTRTINKYGRVKLKGNSYPVKSRAFGQVVKIRFDPFDLSKVFIYDNSGALIETSEPVSLKNSQAYDIPEESKRCENQVKESARNYFAELRRLNLEAQKESMPNLPFDKLSNKEKKDDK